MSIIYLAASLLILFINIPAFSQLPVYVPFTETREITIRQLEEMVIDSSLLLIMAAYEEDTDSIGVLIDKGYDVNETTGDGVTALMYSASNGSVEIAELLIKNGAKINMVPANGITALTGAAMNNHYEVALLLLQQGADTEIPDDRGLTSLMYASSYDFFEITELLLMFGANPGHSDREGATALHAAALYSQPGIAWLLLDYGADINSRDDFGFTPLMMAVQLGRREMAFYLLENNAAINLKTTDGLSTLAIAVANNHPELARKLIELGADPKARVSGTDNIMNLALWQGNEELISLMRQNGIRRNLLPDFRTLSASGTVLVSRNDFFNGLAATLEDEKYNLLLTAGWYTRPVRRAVLLEFNNRWYDQLWEQRHLFYGSLSMKFPVVEYFRLDERGFYAGLKVKYSKGRYWGTYRYPSPDWHFVPSVGYFYERGLWFYNIGYEYLQLNIIDKSAHQISISGGIRFPVKRDPLIYRTTYW